MRLRDDVNSGDYNELVYPIPTVVVIHVDKNFIASTVEQHKNAAFEVLGFIEAYEMLES